MAGDVLTVGKYPIADYTTGGWLGRLGDGDQDAARSVERRDARDSGTGPVQTRADLQAQFDMLTTLRERFAKMMRQGMGANDMLAAGATKEFDEKWGDPKTLRAGELSRHVAPRARTRGISCDGACAVLGRGD